MNNVHSQGALQVIFRAISATVLALLAGGGLDYALERLFGVDNLIVNAMIVLFMIAFGFAVFTSSSQE